MCNIYGIFAWIFLKYQLHALVSRTNGMVFIFLAAPNLLIVQELEGHFQSFKLHTPLYEFRCEYF